MTTTQSRNQDCCPTCGPAGDAKSALAIACTLDGAKAEERYAAIARLAQQWLRHSVRDGLTLRLTYAAEALAEVEGLVAAEAECCAFLDFALTQDGDGIHLAITAPTRAALAADALFAQFAGVVAA